MFQKSVLLFVLFSSVVSARQPDFNFSKINYGEQSYYYSARSFALGGAGIADRDFLLNPAHSVLNTGFATFGIKGLYQKHEEDRSFPYYDNFGGFVDYGSYYFHQHNYFNFEGFLTLNSKTVLPKVIPAFAVSFSTHTNTDYNYDYMEEVRTTGFTDNILAYNKINSEGVLREYMLNISSQPLTGLNVGISLAVIDGKIEQQAEIDSVDRSMENIRMIESNNFETQNLPFRIDLGASYQINEFFRIASRIKLPYTIEFDHRYALQTQDTTLARPLNHYQIFDLDLSDTDDAYRYRGSAIFKRSVERPLSLAMGMNYKFTNILQAQMNVDFEYTFWSQANDDLRNNLNWDDIYKISVGVEHIFYNKVPLQFGFSYHPLREAKNYARTLFTTGTAISHENFGFNLAIGFSSYSYNQQDIFDNGNYPPLESRSETETDRVKITEIYGKAELIYMFNFAKVK